MASGAHLLQWGYGLPGQPVLPPSPQLDQLPSPGTQGKARGLQLPKDAALGPIASWGRGETGGCPGTNRYLGQR